MRMHVTMILDVDGDPSQPDHTDGGPPYTVKCRCGWANAPLSSWKDAALAAKVHRVNARAREEKRRT